MNGTEKSKSPPVAHVVLRPCDSDAIQLILAYMRDAGILVGKGTTSAAIRFALDHTAATAAAAYDGSGEAP